MRKTQILLILVLSILGMGQIESFASEISQQLPVTFDFRPGKKCEPGAIKVSPSDIYGVTKEGYGYDFGPSSEVAVYPSTSGKPGEGPFFFSVAVPDGNYKVTVTLGSDKYAGETTVRGESRRLFLENIPTRKGEKRVETFIVNKRDSVIDGKNMVKVKANERAKLLWDDRLTLEFNGERPAVRTVTIEPADDDVTTLFLFGDSTVVDNDCEPYTSWGQMIPCFFTDSIAIANYAESGLCADTFLAQKRLDKALTQMKPGDYVFIEFAHNDQKQKGPGRGAYYSFSYYTKQLIDRSLEKGAKVILLTPTRRRFFDENGKVTDTHKDFPSATRDIAARENLPLIDLQEMTADLYEALGVEDSKKLFVHYPANTYKNQPKELKDNTHFSTYGAYEVARCVLEGLKTAAPEVAAKARKEYSEPYSPSNPGKFEDFKWSLSPFEYPVKPDGN